MIVSPGRLIDRIQTRLKKKKKNYKTPLWGHLEFIRGTAGWGFLTILHDIITKVIFVKRIDLSLKKHLVPQQYINTTIIKRIVFIMLNNAIIRIKHGVMTVRSGT